MPFLWHVQKSSQRDYVVALLPTPAEDDEDEGDGELMESKASAKQRGIEKVNEQWIAEHARQVRVFSQCLGHPTSQFAPFLQLKYTVHLAN